MCGISVRTLFSDMDSIYQWNFTTERLQSIKVMKDPDYFEDRRYREHRYTTSRHKHNTRSNVKPQFVYSVGKNNYYSESGFGYFDHHDQWQTSQGWQ